MMIARKWVLARLARRRRNAARGERGAVAIEFAFVAPVMVVMLTGIVEVGLAAHTYLLANQAAAAGATYAMHNGWDATRVPNAIVQSSTSRTITASPAAQTFCGCPEKLASGKIQIDTSKSCGATCATGTGGVVSRRYIKVYASIVRPSVFAKVTALPTTVTASATAQLP